jgi:hypothetical protein
MNNSFDRLIDGMCATLREEVLTRLEDEFARGQVFGVINLLNTFKVRADWSPGFLVQQLQAQARALHEAADSAQGLEQAPVTAPFTVPQPIEADTLLALRDQGNRAISAWLDWLADHRDRIPPETAAAVERALRQAMRSEIEIELKNSPRPLFAQMSSGKDS